MREVEASAAALTLRYRRLDHVAPGRFSDQPSRAAMWNLNRKAFHDALFDYPAHGPVTEDPRESVLAHLITLEGEGTGKTRWVVSPTRRRHDSRNFM